MAVVFDLDGGVDAGGDGHFVLGAVGAMDHEGQGLARGQVVAQAEDIEGLRAVEFQGLGGCAVRELTGEDAHADEIRAMDALEALGDDGADAEQARAFGGPVAGAAGAVFLAGKHDERDGRFLKFHGGVVNRGRLTLVFRHAAFDAGEHEVLDTDVGERAAGHRDRCRGARRSC